MSKKNVKKAPELRFKGFSDDWEQRTLGEVFEQTSEYVNPQKDNIELWSLTVENGLTPKTERYNREFLVKKADKFKVVLHNDFVYNPMNLTLGAIDMNSLSKKVAVSGYYITMRVVGRYHNDYFRVWSRTSLAIKRYKLYATGSLLEKQRVQFPTLAQIKTTIPAIDEQEKIGQFFNELDNTIALHQRKLEQLSLLKQAYLQKVYPEQEHKVPKLRFANFQEDWKQRKLGSVTERITRKNKKLESTLPLTISAQYGLVDQETFFKKIVASKDVSGYFLLMNGEFAYNKSYSKDYPWGAVKRLDLYDKGVLSTLYITFKPIKVDSNFLIHYYDTTKWHKEVAIRAAEGARNHGLLNITAADFFDTNLPIPEADQEQYKIGMLFKQLDETITLHQQKLEKLQTLKKAYLQKMFI